MGNMRSFNETCEQIHKLRDVVDKHLAHLKKSTLLFKRKETLLAIPQKIAVLEGCQNFLQDTLSLSDLNAIIRNNPLYTTGSVAKKTEQLVNDITSIAENIVDTLTEVKIDDQGYVSPCLLPK